MHERFDEECIENICAANAQSWWLVNSCEEARCFGIISGMSSSVKFPIHAYCRFGIDKGRYVNLEKRVERLEEIREELTK